MLSNWQKNNVQYIPKKKPGYEFLFWMPVFIPIRKMKLLVWERQVQRISFVQECILSSINLSPKTIEDLSDQFGVPEEIMLQIVSELDTEQLAAVSAGSIIITGKGKQALQEHIKVQIHQSSLGILYINQITGDISENQITGLYKEPPKNQVYLDEEIITDITYLRTRFDELAILHKENRIDNSILPTALIDKIELYRILDITYNELAYIKENCAVYLNPQDLSLAFQFQSGIALYEKLVLKQLSERKNGVRGLFNLPDRETIHPTNYESMPIALIAALSADKQNEDYDSRIEYEYYQDRPLLDGEVKDILENCSDLKANRILICAPYISEIINGDICSAILSQSTKELFILHGIQDRRANDIIKNLKSISKNRKDLRLITHATANVPFISVLIGDKCAISAFYERIETIYRHSLYKLHSSITYDSSRIKELWSQNIKSFFPQECPFISGAANKNNTDE